MTTEFVLKEMDGELWVLASYLQEHLQKKTISYDEAHYVGQIKEREACAVLVEQMGIEGYGTLMIAAAIRARGRHE